MDQAAIDEPVVHEPQAEPSLEASWQPGDAQGYMSRKPPRTPSPRWNSDGQAKAPDARGSMPGLSGTVRCGWRRRRPLRWMPRRQLAAGDVAPDCGGEAGQHTGEPALEEPQGVLQRAVLRVAVHPDPLGHQVRQLPDRLRVVSPARRQPGHVAGPLNAGDPLDPGADLGEPGRVLRLGQAQPERGRRLGRLPPGDRLGELSRRAA